MLYIGYIPNIHVKRGLSLRGSMAEKQFPFQPGVILYDVILGLLRARGVTFDKWCAANKVAPSSARNALYGQSRRAAGRKLLDRMIDAACRDGVVQTYTERVRQHADEVENITKRAA